MACIIGKENLPSERSSANPLFDVYCKPLFRRKEKQENHRMTHFCTVEVHEVVADLEIYSNEIYEGDIITTKTNIIKIPRSQEFGSKSYTSTFVVAHAIINLIPIRSKPPVSSQKNYCLRSERKRCSALLLTMDMYSASDGH